MQPYNTIATHFTHSTPPQVSDIPATDAAAGYCPNSGVHYRVHFSSLVNSYYEGRESGREEGDARRSRDDARNALAEGLSPELVHRITGLDTQTILQIASSLALKQP
jgi:hypothetical protein